MKKVSHNDEYYMYRCQVLGKSAGDKGNSPVGALLVRNNEIVAEGEEANRTKNDVTCHAEIEALRTAVLKLKTNDLSDCVMYSTHEPCVMCSYAIRFYRIKKVVFLHKVPCLGGYSSSMSLLTSDEVPPNWGKSPEVVCLDISG